MDLHQALEKRSAILEAAAHVFVAEGLSAPTAGIAKAAGVANGSLFIYFETKADLLIIGFLNNAGIMQMRPTKNAQGWDMCPCLRARSA
jgi:AcrR family transcriptional regulator